jgi:hypothetical protein
MSDIQLYQSQLPAKQEMFVTAYTPGKCLQLFSKVNTPALCIDSGIPTLATIRKQYSQDFIIAYLAMWILNLNEFINVPRKMSPEQMEETATILYQEYHFFNLADINLIFRRIKKGEFGQLFADIDGLKILSWFEKYAQERMRTAADQQITDHSNFTDEFPRKSEKAEAEKIQNIRAKGFHTIEGAKK